MASTLTQEQTDSIKRKLSEVTLVQDLGAGDHVCSMAAINLALYGKLTDAIPKCMSAVIGTWIILVQDKMTPDLRNCPEWRELLPQAAGTGRDPEKEAKRLELLVNWAADSLVHFVDDAEWGVLPDVEGHEYVSDVRELYASAKDEFMHRYLYVSYTWRKCVSVICSAIPANADNGIWDEYIDPLRLLEAMLAV